MKLKSIVVAIAIIFTSSAYANGGGIGGASEVTQLLNNTELVTSVGYEAGINATVLQQYITQVSQLARMDKNLLQQPTSVIQAALGGEWSNVAPFVAAFKASSNLRDAADVVSRERSADISAMRNAGLTPSQYYSRAGAQAEAGSTYWRDAESQELLHMQQFQKRAEQVEDLNSKVPEIDGNVKGFQHLALQAGRTQALMIDQQMQYSRMMQMQQQYAEKAETRKREGTESADDYYKAREAEKAGLESAFSYPKKGK